jgi:hypothetical protein
MINSNNELLQTYESWIRDHLANGYHQGYLLTFAFSPIQGSDQTRILQMKKRLGWFYGRLAKASVPKPSHPNWSSFLPMMVLAPDFPVFKHSKQQLREVTINNGLHWHGIALLNLLAPKLQEPLDVHIERNLDKYLVRGLRQIDVRRITHEPEYVTGYCMKSLKNRFSADEIVIFPRTVSELPQKTNGSNGPFRAPAERPTYDFQRA